MDTSISKAAFCLLLLFAGGAGHADGMPPLRFLVVDGHALPLGESPRGVLGQGIIREWQDALAAQLGRSPVNLVLPRKRQDQAVAQHKVDLRCFVSPEWLPAGAIADYDWPAPFLAVEERIVAAAGAAPLQTLDDLDGKTIGTVHGYQYRTLLPLFEAKRARRDDAPSEAALLLKQLAGRTDVSVMRALDFAYLQRRDARLSRLALSPLVVSRFSMYCARTKYSSVTLEELSAAQEKLRQAGVMEKILQKYK